MIFINDKVMAKKGTKKAAVETVNEEIKQETPVAGAVKAEETKENAIPTEVDIEEVQKSIESVSTEIKMPEVKEEPEVPNPLDEVKNDMVEVEKVVEEAGNAVQDEKVSNEKKVEEINKAIEKIDELSKKTEKIINEAAKKQKNIINVTSWWNGSGYDF